MPTHQLSLTLITHTVNQIVIPQRSADGYMNATDMCKAAGKRFNDYTRLGATVEFLDELASVTGIPATALVTSIQGGPAHLQGSWVHPDVAVHLAQWLSPKFAVMVSKWVREWLSGGRAATGKLPFHLQRHMLNFHKIPTGYFSILQEMTNALTAPMEAHGYQMAENLMPDIAHAKMLCKHLRDKMGVDTDSLPQYTHEFPDGRKVSANLYPLEYLGVFRKLLAEHWLPEKAAAYFKTRDPLALTALDKMLLIASEPAKKKISANKAVFKRKA